MPHRSNDMITPPVLLLILTRAPLYPLPEVQASRSVEAMNRKDLVSFLEEMMRLVRLSDVASIELLELHSGSARRVLGPEVEALERALQQFDFELSYDLLRRLRAGILPDPEADTGEHVSE